MIKDEFKFIRHNKLIMLSVIVIMFIPFLYAIFFLKSVWDPYGDTQSLPVAVVNNDVPVDYQGKTLDVGAQTVKKLKHNDQLGWQFVSAAKAADGLKHDKYYTVVTIPKNFSKNAATVLDAHPKKMQLKYTTNDSLNYLSQVISGIGVDKLDKQIRANVTNAYASAVFDQIKTVGKGFSKAASGATQLSDGTATLDDGVSQYTVGVSKVNKGVQTLKVSVKPLASGVQQLADGGNQLKAGIGPLTSGVQQLANGGNQLKAGVGPLTSGVQQLANGGNQLKAGVGPLTSGVQQLANGSQQLQAGVKPLTSGVQQLTDGSQQLQAGVEPLAAGASQLVNGAVSLKTGTAKLNKNVSPLAAGVSQLSDGANNLNTGIQQYTSGTSDLVSGVKQLQTANNTGDAKTKTPAITDSIAQLAQGSDTLNQGAGAYVAGVNQSFNTIRGGISQIQAGVKTNSEQASATSKKITADITQLTLLAKTKYGQDTQLNQAIADLTSQLKTLSTQQANSTATLNAGLQAMAAGLSTQNADYNKLTAGADQLTAGAKSLATGATALNKGYQTFTAGLNSAVAGGDKLLANNETLTNGAATLNGGLAQINQQIPTLTAGVAQLDDGAGQLQGGLTELNGKVPALTNGVNQLADGLNTLNGKTPALANGVNQLSSGLNTLNGKTPALASGVNQLSSGLNTLNGKTPALASGVNQLASGLNTLNSKTPALASGVNQLADGTSQLDDKSKQLTDGTGQLKDGSKTLATSLSAGAKQVNGIKLTNETAKMFAAPTHTTQKHYSYVSNYGHALAPYVLSLALYVGALVFNFAYPIRKVSHKDGTPTQWFASKVVLGGLVAIGMAVIEASLIMLGGLTVDHVGLFYALAIVFSLTSMYFVMMLSMAFDNPGRFVAMIMLMLQLGGAGGTFPLEITNSFYNAIHPFLPMSYSVLGFRQAITGGIYSGSVANCFGFLIGFAILSLLLLWVAMQILQKRHLMGISQLDDNQKLQDVEK
jgi:putative membrane protein